jgi:hypothetical protein
MNTGFRFKQGSPAQQARTAEIMIQQDPGGRGLARWAISGQLFPAAISLLGGVHILILTGFYILAAQSIETDGPPGTAILAEALLRAGKRITILTDNHARGILEAALAAIECKANLMTFSHEDNLNSEAILPPDITHCVALERPGLAADGLHHNFRGLSISDHIACLDNVYLRCIGREIITVGIGDGGNELGMGNVSRRVDQSLAPQRAYSCHIPSDFCLCAGVSNWAGYALAAVISRLAGRNLMPEFTVFNALLEAIVRAGAVDGVTGQPVPTVDSLSRDWEDGVYSQMYALAGMSPCP